MFDTKKKNSRIIRFFLVSNFRIPLKQTHKKEKLLPPRRGCVLWSWSAPGRVESLRERTDLRLWMCPPCTPPWAVLRTDSSGGLALSPAPPSPGMQTSDIRSPPLAG